DRVDQARRVLRDLVFAERGGEGGDGRVLVGDFDDAGRMQRCRQGGEVVARHVGGGGECRGAVGGGVLFVEGTLAQEAEHLDLVEVAVGLVVDKGDRVDAEPVPDGNLVPP